MSGLQGKRVVVTRPRRQSEEIVRRLAELGAVPVAFPTIEIVPQVDQSRLVGALERLQQYAWLIFTSQNAVEVFWEAYARLYIGLDALTGIKTAAIGPATARALTDRGVSVHYVPEEFVAEAVARGIGDVRGKRILLPRAEIARPALVDELEQRGAAVDEIPIYQTVLAKPDAQAWQELEQGVDYITFTSSSTVRNFFSLLGERAQRVLSGTVTACIGPITARTLEEYGVRAVIVADEYTTGGLVQALLDYTERANIEG